MQRENIFGRKWFWNNSPNLEELQQWISGDYQESHPLCLDHQLWPVKDIKVALSIYWFNWQSDQNWILVEKLSQNIEGGSAAEQMQGIESLKGRQYGHKMPSVIHKLTQKAITAEWIHWNVHVLFTDTRKPYQSRSSIKKPVEESQNCGFPWPSHHIPSLSVHCYLEGFHNVALAQRR